MYPYEAARRDLGLRGAERKQQAAVLGPTARPRPTRGPLRQVMVACDAPGGPAGRLGGPAGS